VFAGYHVVGVYAALSIRAGGGNGLAWHCRFMIQVVLAYDIWEAHTDANIARLECPVVCELADWPAFNCGGTTTHKQLQRLLGM
jgi:hypothetical protein